jgi:hypothetical protein
VLLTPRDEDILLTLTEKGRLLDKELLALIWWSVSRSGRIEARRRAEKLVAVGLLRRLIVLTRPLPPLDAPVLAWDPSCPSRPDFARAAGVFRSRWSKPPRSTAVYIATPKAAAMTGGVAPGLKHPLQASHDRAVMSVYQKLKREHPALAASWLGEDCIAWPRGLRVRRPDAVLRDESGRAAVAVEIGGSGAAYGRARLEEWHEHFASLGIPYLFW